jgi:arylsulfatase A-like enzyme
MKRAVLSTTLPMLVSLIFLLHKPVTAQGAKPNILLIMTDQQYARAMSCEGFPGISTPSMDTLAAHGVRFRNAFCAFPLCVPSRASIFTGRMPHEIGIDQNTSPTISASLPMVGRVLANAGYDVAYTGKWHIPVLQTNVTQHGFSIMHANVNSTDRNVARDCDSFLNVSRTKPFFLVASIVNPHDICEWQRDGGGSLPNGAIPDPPAGASCPPLFPNFAIPASEPPVIRRYWASDTYRYGTGAWTNEHWRQYRWAYHRLVEKPDSIIGRILTSLKNRHYDTNTAIIFIADHGDGMGTHHWNEKSILYEEEIRVPFIVSYKGKTTAGGIDNHLVSAGLDVFPTICDYAGVTPPATLEGRSVRTLAEGGAVSSWRTSLVTETRFDVSVEEGRTIRDDHYKYMVSWDSTAANPLGELREQLTDVQTDSGEMTNLAVNASYSTLLAQYRCQLLQWGTQTNDNFPYFSCITSVAQRAVNAGMKQVRAASQAMILKKNNGGLEAAIRTSDGIFDVRGRRLRDAGDKLSTDNKPVLKQEGKKP